MEIIRNSVQTEHCLYGVFNFSLRMPNVCAIIIKRTYVRKRGGEIRGLFSDSERKDAV